MKIIMRIWFCTFFWICGVSHSHGSTRHLSQKCFRVFNFHTILVRHFLFSPRWACRVRCYNFFRFIYSKDLFICFIKYNFPIFVLVDLFSNIAFSSLKQGFSCSFFQKFLRIWSSQILSIRILLIWVFKQNCSIHVFFVLGSWGVLRFFAWRIVVECLVLGLSGISNHFINLVLHILIILWLIGLPVLVPINVVVISFSLCSFNLRLEF